MLIGLVGREESVATAITFPEPTQAHNPSVHSIGRST